MIFKKVIFDEKRNEIYTLFQSPDFEYVDPIKHFRESFIITDISEMRRIIMNEKPTIPIETIEMFIEKRAIINWSIKLKEIHETQVPQNLISLLTANSKKEQVKLLKNLTISTDQLLAFIIKAWTDHGFVFSQYRSEHLPKGINEENMPHLVEIYEGEISTVGETIFSEGHLKQIINHRKGVVSKFFDNNKTWHCLFLTFNSINGKEKWNEGHPHCHYISDKFGLSREDVVKQLKGKKYKLGNLPHIDMVD